MKVRINIPVEVEIGDTVSIPDITEQIESQELERQALRDVVEAVDEFKTKEETGEKHHPDKKSNFRRAGTTPIKILSNFGILELNLNRIRSFSGITTHTKVVLQEIGNNGYVQLTEGMKEKLRSSITDTSYRRLSDISERLIGFGFKKDILWDIVRELGIKASETYTVNSDYYDLVLVDGSGGKGKHQWYIFVGINSKTGKMILLHHSVYRSMSDIKTELFEQGLITEKHIIVADGETGIHRSFKENSIQMCAFHFEKTLCYHLWSDGMMFKERKPYVKEIQELLNTLKNSVKTNAIDNPDRLLDRINQTKGDLIKISDGLKFNGFTRASRFIKKHVATVTLFASEALKSIKIPWTNNIMERFVGEITYRIKHSWAHWSPVGLNSIIHLVATKYCKRNKVVIEF